LQLFQWFHRGAVPFVLRTSDRSKSIDKDTEAILIESRSFVEKVESELGLKAVHRDGIERVARYALREATEAYGRKLTCVCLYASLQLISFG
jgi:hypothetical protein